MRLIRSTLLLLIAAAPLPACSFLEPPPQVRGSHVDPDELAKLKIGQSTRNDAMSALGSPTAKATFDDNTWIYISEVTRPQIARTLGVEKQNVTVLSFDQSGVLRDVRHLNQKDAQPVQVVSRTTPSPGSEASFLQQLLGNVGRFTPLPTRGPSGSSGGGLQPNL